MSDRIAKVTEFDYQGVFAPSHRLQRDAYDGRECSNLFLQTFSSSPGAVSKWVSTPPEQWPLLATILMDRIILKPIHANPHAQRYLSNKHGSFDTVVYLDDRNEELPVDVDAALAALESRLPHLLFSAQPPYEVGLTNDVEEVWQSLGKIGAANVLVVANKGSTSWIDDDTIQINENELDSLRRRFNRIRQAARDAAKRSKQTAANDELLAKIDPARFVRLSRTNVRLVEFPVGKGARSVSARERIERQSAVRDVRDNLPVLATEAPRELLHLRAEIERVTLTGMIDRFEALLGGQLSESQWQRFFEDNVFVLSLLFARPVRLLHTQFHAQGSGLSGAGAQIGDFLLAEHGQALAIVEIKTPSTELMLKSPYRNSQVFAPTSHLSGAITQTLFQQSSLRSNWLLHRADTRLTHSQPDAIKCFVIAGTVPEDDSQRRSFEIFRSACKDVEVVTFDELLAKLRLLLNHLTPAESSMNVEVPF